MNKWSIVGRLATGLGFGAALLSGLGAALMIYGDYQSRHKYGENWDCMALCLLGMFVFWPSFLLSAVSLAVGVIMRKWIALAGLAGLAAMFALLWTVLPR